MSTSYDASVQLVRKLRTLNIKTAVVSSADNCTAVLEAAGITQLFDVQMDCLDVDGTGPSGKPESDAWWEAVRRLGTHPSRVVVVTRSIVGIEAGHGRRFGCVIGVDRGGRAQELRDAGADVVV